MAKSRIREVSDIAAGAISDLVNKPVESTTGVKKTPDDWRAVVEVLERKSIPDTQDILGVYEVVMTHDLEVLGYRRIGLRHRGDMNVVEEMEE